MLAGFCQRKRLCTWIGVLLSQDATDSVACACRVWRVEISGKTPIGPCQLLLQKRPIEARTRIVFASRRDVFVSRNVHHRKTLAQGLAQAHRGGVLGGLKEQAFQALKLDADRSVVAALASAPAGLPGMPGPGLGVDELHNLTVAPNKEVTGDLNAAQVFEVGVSVPVQAVGKKRFDVWCAVLTWGQADGVNHHQIDGYMQGARPKVG